MNTQRFNETVFGSEVKNLPFISTAMNGMVFNTTPFCGGHPEYKPYVPVFWGAPPNFGGGWASSGIVGTYYSNNNYTGTSFQRNDVRIDIPLTTVLPGGSLSTDPVYGAIPATNFSVKWIGSLIPKYTGTYILKVKSGGTLTLKIAGATVATATSSSGWVSASYPFTSGTTYTVEVDYVQGTGSWGAQVHWMGSGPVPFPEEAIGPACPVGANVNNDDQCFPANGALIASYYATLGGGTAPALDSSGWPTGDFGLHQLSTPRVDYTTEAFPNVGYASTGFNGIWTISFDGAAEIYTDQNGLFYVGHNDGSRSSVSLNSNTYYNYGNTLPLAAQVYDSTTNTGYNAATNKTIALFDLRNGGWDNIGFRNTDRNGKGAPGGPNGTAVPGLTNVVCMRPSGDGATTSLPPGTVVNPPFLTTMSHYTCARNLGGYATLDFVASYASPRTDWDNRPTPVFNVWPTNKAQYPGNRTQLPWEYRILACNLSGKDMYVNLPQTASGNVLDSDYTSSYIYRLADLIKNGVTWNGVHYPGLLPHLCVYIEYGNENWNFNSPTPPQGAWGNVVYDIYLAQQANTLDWQQYSAMGAGVTYVDGGTQNNADVGLWTALKIKNASDIFRIVFGDAVMPGGPGGYNPDPRIRPILEWQYGGYFPGSFSNPTKIFDAIKSHFGIVINYVYWGGGGGWYLVMNLVDANVDSIFANLSPTIALNTYINAYTPPGYTNTFQQDTDYCAKYGIHHVGYEGGFSIGNGDSGANLAQQKQAANDVRIIPYVKLILDTYFQAGGSLPIVFDATGGAYGFQQCYEVIDGFWDQPPYATAPPKLQAYLTAQASLPAPVVAPSAWPVVPAGFSWIGLTTAVPFSAHTFVVSTAGYYSVGFTTNTSYNSATSLVTIKIDETIVGSLQTTHLSGGDSLNVLVWLAEGVHDMTVSVGTLSPSNGQLVLGPWGVS